MADWINSLIESEREEVGLVFLTHSNIDGVRSKRVGEDFTDSRFYRCGFTASVDSRSSEQIELQVDSDTHLKIEKGASNPIRYHTGASYEPISLAYDEDLIAGTHRMEIHSDEWREELNIASDGYDYIEESQEYAHFYAGVIEGFVTEASADHIVVETSDEHRFELKEGIYSTLEPDVVHIDPSGDRTKLEAGEVWRGGLPIPE